MTTEHTSIHSSDTSFDFDGPAPWDADIRTMDCRRAFNPDDAKFALECSFGIRRDMEMPAPDPRDTTEMGWLRRMAGDPLNGWRPAIRVTADNIGALARLAKEMPNFTGVVDLVMVRAMASHHTRFPFEMPPILVCGPDGIGKTRFVRKLADALGTRTFVLEIPVPYDNTPCGGLPRDLVRRGIGIVTRSLVESTNEAPLILVDDIDEFPRTNNAAGSLMPLHALLTTEPGGRYQDHYINVAVRADRIIWVATATTTEGLPAAIVDRFLIAAVDRPTPPQMRTIARTIAVETSHRLREVDVLDPIDDEALDLLGVVTPRHARRLIENATAAAVAAGRGALGASDIECELRRGTRWEK